MLFIANMNSWAHFHCSLQQYCVLNQVLEFHSIVQSQLACMATFNRFLAEQHGSFADENQEYVEDDVRVVQFAFEVRMRLFRAISRG